MVGLRWSSWCEKVVTFQQVLCSCSIAWISLSLYMVSGQNTKNLLNYEDRNYVRITITDSCNNVRRSYGIMPWVRLFGLTSLKKPQIYRVCQQEFIKNNCLTFPLEFQWLMLWRQHLWKQDLWRWVHIFPCISHPIVITTRVQQHEMLNNHHHIAIALTTTMFGISSLFYTSLELIKSSFNIKKLISYTSLKARFRFRIRLLQSKFRKEAKFLAYRP